LVLRDQLDPQLVANLLPSKFILSQLQNLYEILLDQKLDKRNFRKNILKIGLAFSMIILFSYSFNETTPFFSNHPLLMPSDIIE
jgi:hypothetical protein